MFVAFLCLSLATQQITAVVNNPKTSSVEESSTSKNKTESSSNVSSSSTKVADSVAAGTEQEAKRREAPAIVISDTYGAPLIGGGADSYVPSGPSSIGLPVPVYGVPDAPSNNIIYPGPPPDIPPPLPQISSSYGTPLKTYGPPQPVHNFGNSHSVNFAIPPPPPPNYGLPIKNTKPYIAPVHHAPKPLRPRPQYGPPKPIFVPKQPKPNYGLPKPYYGAPKLPTKPLFVPQKTNNNFKTQSVTIVTIPTKNNFGVPNINVGAPNDAYGPPSDAYGPPVPHFGAPEPIHHGPPHPGVPAPPTPPDIKYDGWQPIPGLVSRPPSGSFGGHEEHHGGGDLQFNTDFIPPPVSGHGGHNGGHGGHGLSLSSTSHGSSSSHSIGGGYSSSSHGVSDSYGAPLNSVTGSGGIVSSSGDSHHDDHSLSLGLSAAGIHAEKNQLAFIKSIGYELFPNSGGSLSHIGGDSSYLSHLGGSDSYSSPPLSSYSPNGPYAAAHSYKTNGISSGFGSSIKSHHNSHKFHHGSHSSHNSHNSHGSHSLSLSSSGIGLIPPSGFYGTPPSGHYGTPLLSRPSTKYGAPLNALKINPPKHPVIFREPVPSGLIESIGQHTAHKDAHGIIESSHSSGYTSGPTYIPPPVPDVSKPVREEAPLAPSTLYSLPSKGHAVSFQNFAHGSSSAGIDSFGFNSDHFGGDQHQFLTSYTAPLGSIDGSYSLPLHSGGGFSVALDNAHSGGVTVGIDHSHPPLTIDLTSSTSNFASALAPLGSLPQGYAYQNAQHDCSLQKSQPLPSLSYGVPSANSYSESLASLTTNIEGAYQGPPPSLSYGQPDLQVAHSQKVNKGAFDNAIESESEGKSYGKSLGENFAAGSELIKSESIDINNIPLQGNMGSYTLQIQSADDLGGSHLPPEHAPHAQVLNNGLLQSILAAIEQPQQKDATILGEPAMRLQPISSSYEPQIPPSAYGDVQAAETQNSRTNAVVVSPPVTEATTSTKGVSLPTQEPESDTDASLRLIDNNEIALYFSNNSQGGHKTKNSNGQRNNTSEVNGVRNGQQYGSYVSFKMPNGSFMYGNLPTSQTDKSQDIGEKD